jgi:inorganic pyrophosphatase
MSGIADSMSWHSKSHGGIPPRNKEHWKSDALFCIPTRFVFHPTGMQKVYADEVSMTRLHRLPTWADKKRVYAVVETPRGNRAKLAYDPKLDAFTLSKPLFAGLTYPYDWGFIPSTKAQDGDPLDALIIHEAATYPGVVLSCKPIGVIEIVQIKAGKKERNDRIFVVPDRSPFEGDLQDIRHLPARAIEELERFFEATNALEKKELKFNGWHGPAKAIKIIKELSL